MTKFSLCLIALTFIICSSHVQAAGEWTTVPPSQYNDTNIQKFLNYGIDKVYISAVSKGKLSPSYSVSDFIVIKIYNIQTQDVSGTNYKYNLTLMSTNKAITITTNFIIYNQAWTNLTRITSLHYLVYSNKKTVDGYNNVPESDYNNTDIKKFLDFGVKNVISQGVSDKNIPSTYDFSDFTVTKINSIQEQIVNGINYKYDIVIESNDLSMTIYAVFVVFNQAWTNMTDISELTMAVEHNSVGGYTFVPASEYNNSDIQEFMNFGIANTIAQAVESKKISEEHSSPDDFVVAQINGIWEQVVSGINYKYHLVLESTDKKVGIETEFVVFNQEWTNTIDIESSTYDIIEN